LRSYIFGKCQGIVKTKGHLPKGIGAKRACKCGLFLVFGGNQNLGIAGIPVKEAIESPAASLSDIGPRRAKESAPSKW